METNKVIESLSCMGEEIFKLLDADGQLEGMSESKAKKVYFYMLREAEAFYKEYKDKDQATFLTGCMINLYYAIGLSDVLGRFEVDDICEFEEDEKIRQYVKLEEQFIYEKMKGAIKLRIRDSILGRKRFEELAGETLDNPYNPEYYIEKMLLIKPKFQFANTYIFIEAIEKYFYSGGNDKEFVKFAEILDMDIVMFVLGKQMPETLIKKSQNVQLSEDLKKIILSLGIPRIDFMGHEIGTLADNHEKNCNEVIITQDSPMCVMANRLGLPYIMTYDKEIIPNILLLVMEQNRKKKVR